MRKKFLEFFEKRGHKIVPSSSLVPTDSSVLFTTAGMQQFKPYYLGEPSPWGQNVASIQKCVRTSDIEEVGDERHLTFFEMLGNFSFGGYWKKEAIEMAYEFVAKEMGLEIDYVTVFSPEKVAAGDWRREVPEDNDSYEIWKKIGLLEIKIKKEGIDNFWGPTGKEGPCGPTTEIYVNGIEIWNIVFNEFFCDGNKNLEKLKIQGIDTGMGLERLAMVVQNKPTIFETDLFESIVKVLPLELGERKKRIVADHARAAAFLIADGIRPSNKDQGYVARRLIRRIVAYEYLLKSGFAEKTMELVVENYSEFYPELRSDIIKKEFGAEKEKFLANLGKGIKEYSKMEKIDAVSAFLLYQSFGLPFDAIKEMDAVKSGDLSKDDFEKELARHQELSRTASAGMFRGGLADDNPKTIKLHTAHHLLLAAIQQLFGKQVKQKGSNINSERLRLDFSFDRKLTEEEKKQIEEIVNQKISEGLDVVKREMPIEEARKIGAEMEFGVKYGNSVSVYFIEDKKGNVFSKEFCGGPHVSNTAELGKFKIVKEEAVSAGTRRIKATLE